MELALCLIKGQAIVTHQGMKCMDPLILNLDISRSVDSFSSRSLYPLRKISSYLLHKRLNGPQSLYGRC